MIYPRFDAFPKPKLLTFIDFAPIEAGVRRSLKITPARSSRKSGFSKGCVNISNSIGCKIPGSGPVQDSAKWNVKVSEDLLTWEKRL